MKYMMLVDIEGATGITTFRQAEHEQIGIDMLMHDVNAVLEGILSVPGNEVLIFEEHTDGCNIVMSDLPKGVHVVRGKPVINEAWRGIDSSFDGVIMVGLHARKGTKGALLHHSYGPQNKNITINGIPVGEIGVEAGMAGDSGVPLVLVTADSAGCQEAKALVPGVMTVCVKEALGDTWALCYNPKDTWEMLYKAGEALARGAFDVQPLHYGEPVKLTIELEQGPFCEKLRKLAPEVFTGNDTISFEGSSVTEAWQQSLRLEWKVNHDG